MSGNALGGNENPLLNGSFGVFQSAAGQATDTAGVWKALRVNAATWQYQSQGGGELPPIEELEAQGAQILSRAGVGIQQVNAYRNLAGQWASAKRNLQTSSDSDQVMRSAIFQPPWATTNQSGVTPRYRIKVQWQVETNAGDVLSTWGTYELDSPLTSIGDALAQASQMVGKKPTSDTPIGASVTDINDYEIEQI